MRTNFTAEQLADPGVREANAILETCVHYGFCTNTCPTYVLTRDEKESPRGRIDLIREMLEAGGPPKPDTVRHLDSCLSCLSCMTTCAAKVDYGHLIDRARAHIEDHYRRPLTSRALRAILATVLTRPRLFAWSLRVGRQARRLSGVAPASIRRILDFVPSEPPMTHVLRPGMRHAEKPARRVAILAGCAQQVLNGNINDATVALLRRYGCDVLVSEGGGCCGSLALHMGRERGAKAWAAKNVEAWARDHERLGIDAIVVNASGCGTTVKDYGHLFARDEALSARAQVVSRLARDVSEIAVDLPLVPTGPQFGFRVAYHDPCSIRHGQKITEPPRVVLRRLGFEVVDVPEGHFCCGSAGTYNLLRPDMADALGRRKADHIESTGPDIIATGNIGCMTQIARFSDLPIVHWVELADWATGGTMPPALAGRPLRVPDASGRDDGAGPAISADAGFW